MFKPNRLIAIGAAVGAVAAAGPVAGASASVTPPPVSPATNQNSSVPCYPFPAYCDATTGQPASSAPNWVRLALGYPAVPPWTVLTFPQPVAVAQPTLAVPFG
jgi:hypothetical protein